MTKQNLKGLLKGLVVIVGCGLIGMVALGYSPFSLGGQKTIQKSINNFTNIKSVEYSGEMVTEVSANNPQTGKRINQTSTSSFSGMFDMHYKDNFKNSVVFNMSLPALGGEAFNFEIRSIGQVNFFKLSNLPNMGVAWLDNLKNQWVKLDLESLKENPMFKDALQNASVLGVQNKLTDSQIEQMKTLFANSKVLKIKEKLSDENIGGVDTRHYAFTIDGLQLNKLFLQLDTVLEGKLLNGQKVEDFNKAFESLENTQGEVWIGKNDGLPYKVSFVVVSQIDEKVSISSKTFFTLYFKNFDVPVVIEEPTVFKTFEEVLGSLKVPTAPKR